MVRLWEGLRENLSCCRTDAHIYVYTIHSLLPRAKGSSDKSPGAYREINIGRLGMRWSARAHKRQHIYIVVVEKKRVILFSSRLPRGQVTTPRTVSLYTARVKIESDSACVYIHIEKGWRTFLFQFFFIIVEGDPWKLVSNACVFDDYPLSRLSLNFLLSCVVCFLLDIPHIYYLALSLSVLWALPRLRAPRGENEIFHFTTFILRFGYISLFNNPLIYRRNLRLWIFFLCIYLLDV